MMNFVQVDSALVVPSKHSGALMLLRLSLSLLVAAALSACHEVSAPLIVGAPVATPSAAPRAASQRSLDAREIALIERAVAKFPGDRGERLRQSLINPEVTGMQIPAHPDAQMILNELFKYRDSLVLAEVAKQPPVTSLATSVTVGIPQAWTYGDATAVVVQRASNGLPPLVLLPESASAANLASGLKALSAMRKRERAGTDLHLVVRDAAVPGNWRKHGTDKMADAMLNYLRGRDAVEVPGAGRVRSTSITVLLGAPR